MLCMLEGVEGAEMEENELKSAQMIISPFISHGFFLKCLGSLSFSLHQILTCLFMWVCTVVMSDTGVPIIYLLSFVYYIDIIIYY